MSIGIRAMRAGQEDAVATLFRQLPRDLGLDVVPKITGESLRSARDLAHVTVAEDSGLLLGACLWVVTFSSWRGARGIYISDLYVMAHARGRKIGERLLRGVVLQSQKLGCSFIKMEVDAKNLGAIGFYKQFGFIHKADDDFYVLEENEFAALAKGKVP